MRERERETERARERIEWKRNQQPAIKSMFLKD